MQLHLEGVISCSGDSPFISFKAKSSLWGPCLLPWDLDVPLPTRPEALLSSRVFLEQAALTAGPGQQQAWQCQALIQALSMVCMSDKQTGNLPDFACFAF